MISIFKSSDKMKVRAEGKFRQSFTFSDINMLVNFMKEHDHRLLKRAPCFFNLCVPCITEEYKLSIFFHTSKKKRS